MTACPRRLMVTSPVSGSLMVSAAESLEVKTVQGVTSRRLPSSKEATARSLTFSPGFPATWSAGR